MFDPFRIYLENKAKITSEQFAKLAERLTYRQAKHGEVLIKPGEPCTFGMFVMSGCLRSYTVDRGKEHILQFAPENWWIGDNYGIIRPDEPARFSIDAVEDSKIALFDHTFMDSMIKMAPSAAEMKLNLEQNAFRALQLRIVQLLSATAEERYTFFISKYPQLATRLPQRMIASYLGMAPQSLSRVRSHYIGK